MANFLSTGLKNLFISLGASKTSDNNYAVPLLKATTKEPAGDMTISQLASVLGVPFIKNVTITDLDSNDCIDNIASSFQANGVHNLPDDMATVGNVYCLYVCFKKNYFALQSLYVSNSNMYIRFIWGEDRSRPWKKVTLA